MSRDVNGNYTLPAGNPVVTGTTITSAWANATMPDIGTALSDSLSRSGSGSMTAALKHTDGTAGAPGIAFGSEAGLGFYRPAAGTVSWSVSATLAGSLTTAGVSVVGSVTAASFTGAGTGLTGVPTTALAGIPSNTTTFLRGDGTWTSTLAGALTISAGGITVTGNSTVTGTLTGLTGLTLASGNAVLTNGNLNITLGGITLTNGGITLTAGTLTINGAAYTPTNPIGNSGTTFTMDCSKSNVHSVTMTGNISAAGLVISNLQEGQTINLYCLQDGTGSRVINAAAFSITLVWAGGIPSPLLSTAIAAKDLITISKIGGVNIAAILKNLS